MKTVYLHGTFGEKFGHTIQRLKQEGITALISESDTKRLGFVDRTYMIERGENV